MSTRNASSPLWVDDASAVEAVCRRAASQAAIAVDTEANSFHAYHHRLCLVQLSFAGEDVVMDPLALAPSAMAPLLDILADPRIEKVMHGADYDLRTLDRHLGARVRSVRDTQIAAQLLGCKQTGLAALAEQELGRTLDKRFQRADWARRPLSPEELAYAAADTATLLPLVAIVRDRLRAVGRLAWWEEECAALEEIRWTPPVEDPLAFERISGGNKLADSARDRLAALFAWRERTAANADVAPFRVLGADVMVALASTPPAALADLATVKGLGAGAVRRYGQELLRVLATPPPAPPRRVGRASAFDRPREKRVKELRAVRDEVAGELGLEPGVLAPRSALEQLVDTAPADERGIEACLARRWRTAVLAPRLEGVLASWRVAGTGRHAGP